MRLSEVRLSRCRSQESVAHAMGVSQQRVAKIEATPIEQLSPKTIARYIAALGGTLAMNVEVAVNGKAWKTTIDVQP